MYDALIGAFVDYDFMRRALVGIIVLSLGAAPIGVFLMLRGMSLTGDAMSHAILPGAAAGFVVAGLDLFAMTLGGLIAGLVVALGAGLVARAAKIREDASLAAFYLVSLALGVLVISLKGSNVDVLHVLFGSVLALDDPTLMLMGGFTSVTLIVLALIWRPLVVECVDPGFLRSLSRAGAVAHLIFLMLVVINLVGGFHALGTLLAVGLMMLPALAARFWVREISQMVVLASGLAMLAGAGGLLLSFNTQAPSGPAIIVVAGAIYLLSLLVGPAGGLLRPFLGARHLEG